MQVVASEKPLERAAGFHMPVLFSREAMGFETGRDHRLRLHWLLIEAGTFAVSLIKAIGTNRDKVLSFSIRTLQVRQPTERLNTHLGHFGIGNGLAT